MAKLGQHFITVLDIGTTKVACFVAQVTADNQPRILGIGHQLAQGIKSGVITDIQLAEHSIRAAVGAAEQMAGVNVDKVIINISGSRQMSHTIKAEMPIHHQEIIGRDIIRLVEQGCEQFRTQTQDIIHCIPLDYSIDGTSGIKDPAGMFGNVLGTSLHVVTASSTAIFNLANCLARCHLDIEDYMISSYASGEACLNHDEKELGVTVLDFGGGNTSIAAFRGGKLVLTDTVALGGAHITNDIALGLSTNIESAERTKTLYGNVLKTAKDDHELIDIPQMTEDGESETSHIHRAALVGIIQPRVEEILEMVKERLDASGFGHMGGTIVLTGGSSQLAGLKEYVAQWFNKPTRLGAPSYIEGMAESTKGPAFSTCVGMLKFAAARRTQNKYDLGGKNFGFQNPLSRVVRWFRENF